jgi:predicted site-specific integrase-resolvase
MAQSADSETGDSQEVLSGWMNRDELAASLGVQPMTLAKWQNQRIGPPLVRIGRKVWYRREAVEDWLRKKEGFGTGAVRK